MYKFKFYTVYFGGFGSKWENRSFNTLTDCKNYILNNHSCIIQHEIYVEHKNNYELLEIYRLGNPLQIYNKNLYNEVNK